MRAYQCPIRLSRSELLQHNKCKSVHVSHKFSNLHSAQRTSQCIHDRPWSTWLTCSSMWMIYFLVLGTLSSIATTFFSQHPGRDSQALACCLAITTFSAVTTDASWSRLDRCSCRQKVRRLRLRRRFADPLSTNIFEKVRHAVSCRGTRLLPPLCNVFLAPGGRPVLSGTAASLCVPPAQATAATSGIAKCPEGTRRWSASMLSWVKFICPA